MLKLVSHHAILIHWNYLQLVYRCGMDLGYVEKFILKRYNYMIIDGIKSNLLQVMSGNSILKDGIALKEFYGRDLDKLNEGDRLGVMRTSNV